MLCVGIGLTVWGVRSDKGRGWKLGVEIAFLVLGALAAMAVTAEEWIVRHEEEV